MATVNLSGFNGVGPLIEGFSGKTLNAVRLKTSDDKCEIEIPAGTKMTMATGIPLTALSSAVATPPAGSLSGDAIIVNYNFGPDGATFNPPINVSLNYSDDKIPAGAKDTDLYVAFWDGAKWVKLDSTLDTETHRVTARVSHFTNIALLAAAPKPAPAPAQAPASIEPLKPVSVPTPPPAPKPSVEPAPVLAPAPAPAPEPVAAPAPAPVPAPAAATSQNWGSHRRNRRRGSVGYPGYSGYASSEKTASQTVSHSKYKKREASGLPLSCLLPRSAAAFN